jgi:REP element-mobilizing transposase RayT
MMERFYRRRLPHWEVSGSWYYLTFRLVGTVPARLLDQWQVEAESARRVLEARRETLTAQQIEDLELMVARRVEDYIDRNFQVRYLEKPAVAEAFVAVLHEKAASFFGLGPWVVMPNHVHLLIKPRQDPVAQDDYPLQVILQHIKGTSSRECNKVLGRRGCFWQREYFDRRVRDESDFARKAEYIEANPLTSGLCSR